MPELPPPRLWAPMPPAIHAPLVKKSFGVLQWYQERAKIDLGVQKEMTGSESDLKQTGIKRTVLFDCATLATAEAAPIRARAW